MQLWKALEEGSKDKVKGKELLAKVGYLVHLLWLLKPEVQWLVPDEALPEGVVRWCDPDKAESNLGQELKRIRIIFFDESTNKPKMYPEMKKTQREGMYISILNSVPAIEARFLEEVRLKKMNEFSWVVED